MEGDQASTAREGDRASKKGRGSHEARQRRRREEGEEEMQRQGGSFDNDGRESERRDHRDNCRLGGKGETNEETERFQTYYPKKKAFNLWEGDSEHS